MYNIITLSLKADFEKKRNLEQGVSPISVTVCPSTMDLVSFIDHSKIASFEIRSVMPDTYQHVCVEGCNQCTKIITQILRKRKSESNHQCPRCFVVLTPAEFINHFPCPNCGNPLDSWSIIKSIPPRSLIRELSEASFLFFPMCLGYYTSDVVTGCTSGNNLKKFI